MLYCFDNIFVENIRNTGIKVKSFCRYYKFLIKYVQALSFKEVYLKIKIIKKNGG